MRTHQMFAAVVSLAVVVIAAPLLGGCTVSVDKRVGVYFESGSRPTFQPLGALATGAGDPAAGGAVPGAVPGAALASATAAQDSEANWQHGYFMFIVKNVSDTAADLEQAVGAMMQANVAAQGSRIDAAQSDTGGTATSGTTGTTGGGGGGSAPPPPGE